MVQTKNAKKVLMIGLDASEPDLVERWMGDGSLPNLKGLRDKGAYGRLASPGEWLSAAPWVTFFTSAHPSQHGFYYPFGWRPSEMKHERPKPEMVALYSVLVEIWPWRAASNRA